MGEATGPSAAWWVFQIITAAVALAALILLGISHWHRPMRTTLRIVGIDHSRVNAHLSQMSASLAFVNSGKCDVVVAGAYVHLSDGQLCAWVPSDDRANRLPMAVRAERTELVTVDFHPISIESVRLNAPVEAPEETEGHTFAAGGPEDAEREVAADLNVVVLNKDGDLRDVKLGGVKLTFGKGQALGWSFSHSKGVATLDDMSEQPSSLTAFLARRSSE
jgi:hypothetical protein